MKNNFISLWKNEKYLVYCNCYLIVKPTNFIFMKPIISEESYALVEKMAYKFAYGNHSIDYDRYLNAGLDGLVKAVNTYKEGTNAEFSTYANTCIRNAMCTEKKRINRFDLQEDENVILEDVTTFSEETTDGRMADEVRRIIRDVNNGNERNSEMVMLHIGLVDEEDVLDYKEISARFNVSAERVRQVFVKTMKAIKADKDASDLIYSFVG